MATRRIIPDSYTDYEDGHLGIVPASLANVETKIGASNGGQPNKVYTLSGPDAKKQAKILFKGGPLLQALEEAFDAGSTRIHACRIGTAGRAMRTVKGINNLDALKIKGDFGTSGNNHYLNVTQIFNSIMPGFAAVFAGDEEGDPHRVVVFNDAFEVVHTFELSSEIAQVVGVEADIFNTDPGNPPRFIVLGMGPAPESTPKIFIHNAEGDITETIDLTPFLPEGDTITGLGGNIASVGSSTQRFRLTTDKHGIILDYENGQYVPGIISYADFGIENPDISSGCEWSDLLAVLNGDESSNLKLILDRAHKKIHALQDFDQVVLIGTVDISSLVGADSPEGIAEDLDSGEVLVALRNTGNYPHSRILRLTIDWEAETPTATLVSSYEVDGPNIYGLSGIVADGEATVVVTIQDRNESPVLVREYRGTGTMLTQVSAIAGAINRGGVYEAEILSASAPWLMPSLGGETGGPDPTQYDALSGGTDPSSITNADYLAGLEATKSKTDTAWIHGIGATSAALWNAILLHCAEMFEDHHAERFAILETPAFSSSNEEGSAGYLTDLQNYVDDIVERMAQVSDKNAAVFAGGALFMDSDGNEYTNSVVSSCGGTMAGQEAQKSLINKRVRNVIKLFPEFTPGHIQTLIQNRVNCLRFKPGRGFIIAHSLTAAAEGSDYSRVNDLRAVYYGSKAAREAGQPYVGEENDAAGEGLRRLESAMARPLEQMRNAGQIDAFDLSAVSTEQDRLLGDVYVSLGIQPRRAMEMIYTTVYLK